MPKQHRPNYPELYHNTLTHFKKNRVQQYAVLCVSEPSVLVAKQAGRLIRPQGLGCAVPLGKWRSRSQFRLTGGGFSIIMLTKLHLSTASLVPPGLPDVAKKGN
jgi:hypothetical protein